MLERATASDRIRERRGSRGHRLLVGVVIALALGLGCSSVGTNWPLKPRGEEDVRADNVMRIGQWKKGSLHCEAGRCQSVYTLDLAEPGEVSIQVFAPLDGGPDFDLTLHDAEGSELARPRKRNARPRRIEAQLAPGAYQVSIVSRGDRGLLPFEVVANHATGAGPKPVRELPVKPVANTTRPPPPPPPVAPPAAEPVVLCSADVLDVDVTESETFVYFDMDPCHASVDTLMRGRLRDGGEVIGSIEVTELLPDGGQARVIGELDGEVGIDTKAEFFEGAASR